MRLSSQHRDLIAKDALVLVEGMLRFDEFTDGWRLAARRITDLHKVREEQVRRIVLRWPAQANANTLLTRLAEVLAPWRGGACQISVQYTGGGASGAFNLAAEWAVEAGTRAARASGGPGRTRWADAPVRSAARSGARTLVRRRAPLGGEGGEGKAQLCTRMVRIFDRSYSAAHQWHVPCGVISRRRSRYKFARAKAVYSRAVFLANPR